MIRLAVQDYCQECPAFCPAAYENISVGEDGVEVKVTEVRCERWELCANVARRSKRMEMGAGRTGDLIRERDQLSMSTGHQFTTDRALNGKANVINLHGVTAEVR